MALAVGQVRPGRHPFSKGAGSWQYQNLASQTSLSDHWLPLRWGAPGMSQLLSYGARDPAWGTKRNTRHVHAHTLSFGSTIKSSQKNGKHNGHHIKVAGSATEQPSIPTHQQQNIQVAACETATVQCRQQQCSAAKHLC